MTPVRCFVVLLFLLTFPVCVWRCRCLLPLHFCLCMFTFPGRLSRGRCSPSFPFFSRFLSCFWLWSSSRLVPLPWVSFQFKGEFQENKLIIASGVSLNNFHEYMTHLARCFPFRFHRPDHSFFNQTNLEKRLPAKCLTISSPITFATSSVRLRLTHYHPVLHCLPPACLAVYE